ncbi:MAG: right-handed parallel beta-helix repeat-containing protein [Planctomycetes bacterium]|nr:right-handed parallel beta-helix repeat-containing protein [Planctomycetota bacterium]
MKPFERARPSFWKRLTLRGVVIFTAPLIALALYLVVATVLDYQRVQQFDDWNASSKHVDRLGFNRIRALARLPRASELDQHFSPEDETRPVLRLFVDQNEFDAVANDILGRWGEELEGEVDEHGALQKVGIKLRGDTSVHWTTMKKSFALRADRGRMFKGYRQLAFSAKEVLPAYLANSLPSEFGLVCADTAIVPVFWNDRFYGLFRFTETLDESFLRRHVLLPGNIYRGDAAERGEYFKHQERELFRNLYIWDRAAKNDRPGSFGTAALGEWLAALNGSTDAEFERAMSWVDRDELSRMLALMLACGDPFHMSGVHNQFWYEDPSSGLLHQIPWDIRLLDLERPPANSHFNRALRTFLRDPRVFDGALAELAKQLQGGKLLAAATRRMDELETRFGDMLEYERLREGLIPDVGSSEACLGVLEKNLATVSKWIADARVAVHSEKTDYGIVVDFEDSGEAANGLTVLDFEVRGFAACELVSLDAGAGPTLVYADADLDGTYSDGDRHIRIEADGCLAAPEVLYPAVDASTPSLKPAPLAYRYFVIGAKGPVVPKLVNRNTGAPVEVSDWPLGTPIASGSTWHPWLERAPLGSTRTLSGEVKLDTTLVVRRGESLTIEPGARLVLGPNVSVLAYGRVTAKGTAEAPITFVNAEPRKPWGSLALQGEGANRSEFEHVRFEGGGGALLDRVEYTGMVCVHNAHDVHFRACTFDSNLRCDDMIHADVADLFLIGCRFQNANGDAIDYDVSGGEVRNCTIDASANDGCDFMTCWPAVIGCTITNSGDKGISVGEASRPILFGNTIRDCNRGIEVKDTSEPLIAHTLIERCKTGIRARLKNWRYGYGGWPKVVNSIVADNANVFEFDAKTHVTVHGSQVGASDDVQAPVDAAWLLQGFGLRAKSDRLGPLDSLEGLAPVPPLEHVEFEDDFGPPSDGWVRAAGVRRLDKRVEGLVATFKREPGAFGTTVAWKLDDPSKRYVLAVELGTQDMLSAELVVTAADGTELVTPLDVGRDPTRFQFAVLELPNGSYRGLMVRGEPNSTVQSGASCVFVHRYDLVALEREPRR